MRKPAFCICENKGSDQLRSAIVFATLIVLSLYFLNPKFHVSNNLLWLYSPVCVGPGQKPRRPVFTRCGSFNIKTFREMRVRKGYLMTLLMTLLSGLPVCQNSQRLVCIVPMASQTTTSALVHTQINHNQLRGTS